MTDYTTQNIVWGIYQLSVEPSLPFFLIINGVLIILIIAMGLFTLHLLFKHVDDKGFGESEDVDFSK